MRKSTSIAWDVVDALTMAAAPPVGTVKSSVRAVRRAGTAPAEAQNVSLSTTASGSSTLLREKAETSTTYRLRADTGRAGVDMSRS